MHDAFISLALEETRKTPGRRVRHSEVYNRALAEFLTEHGIIIAGWNDGGDAEHA